MSHKAKSKLLSLNEMCLNLFCKTVTEISCFNLKMTMKIFVCNNFGSALFNLLIYNILAKFKPSLMGNF